MPNVASLWNKRADLDTIMGRAAWTSVKVNGVFVPVDSLQTRLHSFGRNLALFTHVVDYEAQLIGSATGLRYHDHNFLVATAHQVESRPEEDIGILIPEQNSFMTSAGVTRIMPPGPSHDTDAHDLVAFDFTPQSIGSVQVARIFFQLDARTILGDQDNVIGCLAYGCPFVDQKYHIVDNNTVGTVIRSLTCKPSVQPPSDMALGQCHTLQPMTFDPNGLSGGPVFASVIEGTELVLKFAGVINRAGAGQIHYIKAQVVAQLLDRAIE